MNFSLPRKIPSKHKKKREIIIPNEEYLIKNIFSLLNIPSKKNNPKVKKIKAIKSLNYPLNQTMNLSKLRKII